MFHVNTPLPHGLRSEAKKAAKILRDFSIPNAKSGPDKIIPAGVLLAAEGLAIITIARLGFLVTARGGSGIVIAKTKKNEWSPPSAIGIAGLGGGFEVGVEVTDFVIILNKRSAVEAFSKGGNLTLGGNFTIAAGPLGRNIEGDVSLRSPAAIYTYSKSKGLFAGISVEGSVLLERKDANRKFYGEFLRAHQILSGDIERPEGCESLYEMLAYHEEMFKTAALNMGKRYAQKKATEMAKERGVYGVASSASSFSQSMRKRHSVSGYNNNDYGDYGGVPDGEPPPAYEYTAHDYTSSTSDNQWNRHRSQSFTVHSQSTKSSKSKPSSRQSFTTTTTRTVVKTMKKSPSDNTALKNRTTVQDDVWNKMPTCKAIWPYVAQMKCDLTFHKGDIITILTRTGKQDDWWEGQMDNHVGIFPANYVQVM